MHSCMQWVKSHRVKFGPGPEQLCVLPFAIGAVTFLCSVLIFLHLAKKREGGMCACLDIASGFDVLPR